MLEIVFTSKILGLSEIGGTRHKPFEPNGKSAPAFEVAPNKNWIPNLFITDLESMKMLISSKNN